MDDGGISLQRLHQIGQHRLLQKRGHGALRTEVMGGDRGAGFGIAHDHAAKTVLQVREVLGKAESRHDLRGHGDVEMLRARAKRELPARVAAYAAAMGVTPAGVRITSARTRFGSCNAKNSLCFSCYLMANAQPAIDYVIVHELAHIRHKNHSAAFWAEVAKVFPDYRTRRAMLFMPALEKETM